MKAMILAAGLGTRLRPLTDNRPKALVEINGRTMLEITISRLRSFGVREVIVNVYHFADMVVEYLKANDNFGMRIEISREAELLDTGGGLKKAAIFFSKILYILTNPSSCITSMCLVQLISGACWNFIPKIGPSLHLRCRTVRLPATCCLTSSSNFADGEAAITSLIWYAQPVQCTPWPSAVSTLFHRVCSR